MHACCVPVTVLGAGGTTVSDTQSSSSPALQPSWWIRHLVSRRVDSGNAVSTPALHFVSQGRWRSGGVIDLEIICDFCRCFPRDYNHKRDVLQLGCPAISLPWGPQQASQMSARWGVLRPHQEVCCGPQPKAAQFSHLLKSQVGEWGSLATSVFIDRAGNSNVPETP